MTADRWRRIEALYHEMLARPVHERAAALVAASAGDAALQAEVHSLLNQPASAVGFLDTPAAEVAAQLMSQPAGSVLAGRRMGVFEVQGLLGIGGMGEVYRARDTRLGRDVAIKILPRAFKDDPDRLARFEREARVLATLNHPHIGVIYGLEESDGCMALVMEVVAGEDLAQRIARGPIAIAEALPIAKQIAEALEAAHELGIIHRDLKPANIKIRPDGVVKVLDFGLAKSVDGDVASSDLSRTLTRGRTREGVVLGTPAYMSPEQARGNPVSKRSDIWSFGCVLFEMITGTRAFPGDGAAETVSAVLRAEPDWTTLGPQTPRPICTLLKRCLEKDARRRLRDIGDARLELDLPADSAPPESAAATPRRFAKRLAWLSAGLAMALAGAGLGAWAVRSTPVLNEVRLDLNVPAATEPLDLASFAVSPDGHTVVFVAASDGLLWLRSLSSGELRSLRGTEGAFLPFWSPNSRSIGFFADGLLKRIDLDGGLVRQLADADSGVGGSWNRDGVILFAPSPASPLFRVPAEGGPAAALTSLAGGHAGHTLPAFLPDGRHFLWYVNAAPEARGVYVGQLDGVEPRRLFYADSGAAYLPGHLVFLSQGRILAQGFDAERLEIRGVPFSTGVEDVLGGRSPAVSVTAAGVIAYRVRSAASERQFVWFDRSGKKIETVGDRDSGEPLSPSLSPDGRQLALLRRVGGSSNVWSLELRRGLLNRLTTDSSAENIFPIWSRDGAEIFFSSNRSHGEMGLYRRQVTGIGGDVLLLPTVAGAIFASDSSRDGRFLLYETRSDKTRADLWALPLLGTGPPVPVVEGESDDRDGQFSPDGKWVAYRSNHSGRFEVYVQSFPEKGDARRVSIGGGAQVRWRSDGRELFYVALDGRLMAVPIQFASDGPSVGDPVPLFETHMGRVVQPNPGPQYVVSNDGQRFLMNTLVPVSNPTPISIILNWKPRL